MIQDMYDEEYFVQILFPKVTETTLTKDEALSQSLYYKYFSDLKGGAMERYET
jgi:hypothetical protein